MAQEQFSNTGSSTLSSSILAGDTTLTVVSAASFPTIPQFRLNVEGELMLVTGVAGPVFTVTRGIEGTVAAGHGSGAGVTQILTAAVLTAMSQPVTLYDMVNTTAMVGGSGTAGYISSAGAVSPTDATSLLTGRFYGMFEGVTGQVVTEGEVADAQFTTAGGSPANGAPVYLALATDDGSTAAGKLTATAPTGSTHSVQEVGICKDNANYAGSKTAKVLIQPKQATVLSSLGQTTWWIDPQNSSGLALDTNNGLTNTTPLRTIAQLATRLGTTQPEFASAAFIVTVHMMSDTVSTDPWNFTPRLGTMVVVGTLTSQVTGTFSAFQPRCQASVLLASSGRTLTFTNPNTISASSGSFITDGWAVGQTVTASGTASNNGNLGTIVTVSALSMTVTGTLTTEGPLNSTATIAATQSLVLTATATNTLTFNGTSHTITQSSGNFIVQGYAVGQTVTVAGTTSNNGVAGAITAINSTGTVMTFASGLVNEGPLSSTATLTISGPTKAQATTGSFSSWTPYQNMIVQDTTTASWFWIEADIGGGKATVTQPSIDSRSSAGVTLPTLVLPLVSDAFTVWRPSILHVTTTGSPTPDSVVIVQNANITAINPANSSSCLYGGTILQQCFSTAYVAGGNQLEGNGANSGDNAKINIINSVLFSGCDLSDPAIYGGAVWSAFVIRPSTQAICGGGVYFNASTGIQSFSGYGKQQMGDVGLFCNNLNLCGCGNGRQGFGNIATGTDSVTGSVKAVWGTASWTIKSLGVHMCSASFTSELKVNGIVSLCGVNSGATYTPSTGVTTANTAVTLGSNVGCAASLAIDAAIAAGATGVIAPGNFAGLIKEV